MNYEKITDKAIITRLNRPAHPYGHLQSLLIEINEDDSCQVVKVDTHCYRTVHTAQNTISVAIKRMGYRMKCKVLDGEVYIIKL